MGERYGLRNDLMTVPGSIKASFQDRICEIDLLRFMAALFVVLYHYGSRGGAGGLTQMELPEISWLIKYGFLGVHLFFMISGFVILMSIRAGGVRAFVASRLSRLYPAFWFACTLTFLCMLVIGGGSVVSVKEYFANMTMIGGLFNVRPVDGVYWSLLVELRFYFLVALVIMFRRWIDFQRFIALWLVITCVYDVLGVDRLRNLFLIDYSPFFIAGAAFYLVWSKGLSRWTVAIVIFAWIMTMGRVTGIAMEYGHLQKVMIDPFVVASLISLMFFAMGAVALRKTGILARLDWGLLGGVTYPLYLLHQNIGYKVFDLVLPYVNRWAALGLVLGGMLVLSYFVQAQIERRMAPKMRAFFAGSKTP